MSLLDEIIAGKATLADQEEALKRPASAYYFARCIEGADIERCQDVACRNPNTATLFARDIPGANIEKCQEAACKCQQLAYLFAHNVPKANLSKIKEMYPMITVNIDEIVMNRVLI